MATNRVYQDGDQLAVACTAPATPASKDPVLFGKLPGVALTDEDANGLTTVAFEGVFDLVVEGVDNAGNAAIAAGDVVYYDAAATIKLNVDATNGVRFGVAFEAVASGDSDTIHVRVGY